MTDAITEIVKSSGEKVEFSIEKLRGSLKHSGANQDLINQIVNTVRDELYKGISSKEIYNRAFTLLKKEKSVFASKYKLKKAIYELGPTGFPFEKFVAAILEFSGYTSIETDKSMHGICVSHEIDVFAEKNQKKHIIECKFHGEEGRKCNVKVPLYIHSRYTDVKSFWENRNSKEKIEHGWVVTNTRFTKDAIQYGECVGLNLLSWDYPKSNGLKERIDRLGLYPITVSTLLSEREKNFLLSRDIVLCRHLLKDKFFLDHLGISGNRKDKILQEIQHLCDS